MARTEEHWTRGPRDPGEFLTSFLALVGSSIPPGNFTPELLQGAVADLPPERERAARVVSRRGRSAATARYLARRGFDADAVELAAPDPFAADTPAELG